MQVKIESKTPAGERGLNRMHDDSQTAVAKSLCIMRIVQQKPFTVSFTPRALRRLPQSVLKMKSTRMTVQTAINEMMAEYGCKSKDYKVLWNG